jgi:hypothetical protein
MDINWKTTPIELLIDGPLIARLKEAGFNTAGDILDTDASVIAERTRFVGLKRAERVRSEVLDELIKGAAPQFTIIEHTVDEPRLPLWLFISLLLAVGFGAAVALNIIFEAI